MKELKITVDQLKNYLGSGLKIQYGDGTPFTSILGRSGLRGNMDIHSAVDIHAKPTVYRLSDLDKEIEHNGERFVPAVELMLPRINLKGKELKWVGSSIVCEGLPIFSIGNLTLTFDQWQKLFEWHFWPFGDEYFEQGLVIDKIKQL